MSLPHILTNRIEQLPQRSAAAVIFPYRSLSISLAVLLQRLLDAVQEEGILLDAVPLEV